MSAEQGFTLCDVGHDKEYSSLVLDSAPPQYPWVCRRCGVKGRDMGGKEIIDVGRTPWHGMGLSDEALERAYCTEASPNGEHFCTLPKGHDGNHKWQVLVGTRQERTIEWDA